MNLCFLKDFEVWSENSLKADVRISFLLFDEIRFLVVQLVVCCLINFNVFKTKCGFDLVHTA